MSSKLTDLRVFGIQMRAAFQRDVVWVKNAGYTLSSAIYSGARQEAAYLRDAVVNLRSNLILIDDHILQKYLLTQWMSEFAQQLYREEMQSRADTVTRDCIVSKTSSLQCGATSALSLGELILSARSPLTYAKAACDSYVTLLFNNEALTKDEAEEWHYRIKMTFLANDLRQIGKTMTELGEGWKALKNARITKKGEYDKRSAGVKKALKDLRDGFKDTVENLGKEAEEKNKESQGP